MFTIDGVSYDVFCDIAREAEIKASDISGMLLNKNYYNDVLATYIKYTVTMAIPVTKMTEYAELYEKLTNPVASHLIVMPYNNTTISFQGRIETVSDKYYKKGGTGVWRGTQFDVISNTPIKVPV